MDSDKFIQNAELAVNDGTYNRLNDFHTLTF